MCYGGVRDPRLQWALFQCPSSSTPKTGTIGPIGGQSVRLPLKWFTNRQPRHPFKRKQYLWYDKFWQRTVRAPLKTPSARLIFSFSVPAAGAWWSIISENQSFHTTPVAQILQPSHSVEIPCRVPGKIALPQTTADLIAPPPEYAKGSNS